MAYCFERFGSDAYTAGGLVFHAVCENEITSSFDTMEDCAKTKIYVVVEKDDEQIAAIGFDATMGIEPNGVYFFDFRENVDRVAMASNGWESQFTTPEDLDALDELFSSAHRSAHLACLRAMKAAVSEVCRLLESTVRDMREWDLID